MLVCLISEGIIVVDISDISLDIFVLKGVDVGYVDSLCGFSISEIIFWVIDVVCDVILEDESNWDDRGAWAMSDIWSDIVLVKCTVGDTKSLMPEVVFDKSIVASEGMLDVILSPGEKDMNSILGSVVIAVGSVLLILEVCVACPMEVEIISEVNGKEETRVDSLVDIKLNFAVGIVVL